MSPIPPHDGIEFYCPSIGICLQRVATLVLAMLTLAAGISVATGLTLGRRGSDDLAATEAWVRSSFPDVSQISSAQLADMMSRGEPVALLDVREPNEYAVSHLARADRVDPGARIDRLLAANQSSIVGKTVVLYCSVGVRSSKLAEQARTELLQHGAKAVYNLEGGIFRWHGENKPVVDLQGSTDLVHPYDAYWGRLVERQDKVAYQPKSLPVKSTKSRP